MLWSALSASLLYSGTQLAGSSPVRVNNPRLRVLRCEAAEPADGLVPQSYFASLLYDGNVPWDLLGRPQPPLVEAAQAGVFGSVGSTVLDCGCGAGDNANWLATCGFDVLGFDLSPSAIDTARGRAAESAVEGAITTAGGAVEFTKASAIDLGAANRVQARAQQLGGFECAIDSALLHCLDDEAQRAYLDGLRPLIRIGGRLCIGCFSDANPDPWINPRRMSEEQACAPLGPHTAPRVTLRTMWPPYMHAHMPRATQTLALHSWHLQHSTHTAHTPYTHTIHTQIRALLCEESGWRITELKEAWYERPSEQVYIHA